MKCQNVLIKTFLWNIRLGGAIFQLCFSSTISIVLWQVDMSPNMALVMSSKEESELNTIKKACTATVEVFSKYLKEQIMDIIDRDKKVRYLN